MTHCAAKHSIEPRRHVLRALFASTSFFACGCAATDFWAGYAIEPEPTMCQPAPTGALPWHDSNSVFGTPTWGAGPSVFGTPAWGAAPSVYGNRLHVPPGESAAARVLALTDDVAAAKAENEKLASRIHGLEAEVEAGNKALARATSEVVETRSELARARADLEQWKRELADMREKLATADKDNLSTLQSTVGLLQQLMANEQPPADGE